MKQFPICLGEVVILLLNVMVLFNVVGCVLLDRPCMSSKVCVCRACDPSVRLDAPFICFVFLYIESYILI